MIAVFHRPDLLPAEIFKRSYLFVSGHNPESLVGISKKLVSGIPVGFLDLSKKFRIVHGFPYLLQIFENAGSVKNGCIRNKGHLRSCVLDDKWNISVITAFQKLSVTAQHTVGIDLDLDTSFA